MDKSARFAHEELEAFCADILKREGLPQQDAALVAASLVHADLIGVSTHGVARLPSYAERLRRGLINRVPVFKVDQRSSWSASMNADNAMGAVAAERAVSVARRLMSETGIGAVVVRESNHFGTAGYYARMLSGEDGVGICMSPASKSLAPFGSKQPLLGTNPYAVSVPTGRYPPWTMDMASSVAARGHIRIAAKEHKSIPEGWALDSDGCSTTDAEKALRGVMLPFAGPKGSALAMMIEIFGGVMSGSAFAGGIRDMNFDFEAPQGVGHFFMVWKIDAFIDLADFKSRMDTLIDNLKALKPAAGVPEVMYPGEIEAKTALAYRADGVPIKAEIADGLRELGLGHGLSFPSQRAA
ncbi:malate/L-lactate dehydrogenase [Caballeronia udeis]|uniref:Malate/L-lactate dehydrogenase n=1 Tax=Caballeronia udeis TaxID=1232866 RepID=A0A158I638_9BURK|nr:Ldh family oxidoreductase [Caballeronia udeis]SAL51490.1 malate/L-lactate dehydrogenase [Caballeronia udeis]